jgi:hypothetical protein
MTYYYVKHTGSASGTSGTSSTPRTGSFGSMSNNSVYRDLYTAITAAAPADGDTIIISNANDYTYSLAANLELFTANQKVRVISVSDTNVTTPSYGAKYTFTADTNTATRGVKFHFDYVYGLHLVQTRNTGGTYGYASVAYFDGRKETPSATFTPAYPTTIEECYFEDFNDYWDETQYFNSRDVIFRNCTFDNSNNPNYPQYYPAMTLAFWWEHYLAEMIFLNCTFNTASTWWQIQTNSNNGLRCVFIGCDFSLNNIKSIASFDTSVSSYPQAESFVIDRCKTNSYSFPEPIYSSAELSSLIFNSEYNSDAFCYRIKNVRYNIDTVTSAYIPNSSIFPDGTAFSWKIYIHGNIGYYYPVMIPLGEIWVRNFTSTKLLTVNFARENNASALDNNQIWLLAAAGGVSNPTGVVARTHVYDSLNSSGIITLPMTPNVWQGLTNPTCQKVSCSVPVLDEPGMISVFLFIGFSSSTVFLDPKIGIT